MASEKDLKIINEFKKRLQKNTRLESETKMKFLLLREKPTGVYVNIDLIKEI